MLNSKFLKNTFDKLNFVSTNEDFNELLKNEDYNKINSNIEKNPFYIMNLNHVDEDELGKFFKNKGLTYENFTKCIFRKHCFKKLNWYEDYINLYVNDESYKIVCNSDKSLYKIYSKAPPGCIYNKCLSMTKENGLSFLRIVNHKDGGDGDGGGDSSLTPREMGKIINHFGIKNTYFLFKYKKYKAFMDIIKYVNKYEINKCWDEIIFAKDIPTLLLEYLLDIDKKRFMKLLPRMDKNRFNNDIIRKIKNANPNHLNSDVTQLTNPPSFTC